MANLENIGVCICDGITVTVGVIKSGRLNFQKALIINKKYIIL
jgi:hypothetical protein